MAEHSWCNFTPEFTGLLFVVVVGRQLNQHPNNLFLGSEEMTKHLSSGENEIRFFFYFKDPLIDEED